jgi:hypothetical protein
MNGGLLVTVDVPTELVVAAGDHDLPGRCWRHDSPAVRIQNVVVDNYERTLIRGFDNWHSIRWPVCAVCTSERRRALRRAMLALLVSLAVAAIILAWRGFGGMAAVVTWLFVVIVTYLFVYDARWAKIVGVAPCDALFSSLTFIVARDETDEIRAWLDPSGGT